MIADDIINHEINRFNVKSVVEKYRLTPMFETWVSIKGKQLPEFTFTPIADCGVRFYIEGSDVCVGMIHSATNTLRISETVMNSCGQPVLGCFPWQMTKCHDVNDFDKQVGKIIDQHRQNLIDAGKFRLFMVELSNGGYDSYDSAVIACVDKATLEEFCKDKFNRYRWSDDHEVIFEQNFNIHEDQKVESIVEIGVYSGEMYRDTRAKVICSSFNAG